MLSRCTLWPKPTGKPRVIAKPFTAQNAGIEPEGIQMNDDMSEQKR